MKLADPENEARHIHARAVYPTLPVEIRSMAEWLTIMNKAPELLVKCLAVYAWEHEGEKK